MKPTTMQRTMIVLLAFVVFTVSTTAITCAWWLWGPVAPDFEVTKPDAHYARYDRGDIVVFRAARLKRHDMRLTITRDLRKIDLPHMAWAMPTLTLHAGPTPGDGMERRIEVPYELPAGLYELRSTVEWQANPLRSVTTKMPIVRFEVPRETRP